LTFARLDWVYLCGAALAAAGVTFSLVRFGKRDPAQAERRRRERIGRIGRIAQCEILDVIEADAALSTAAARKGRSSLIPPQGKFVVYRYSVSGVVYETSQDFIQTSAEVQLPSPGQIASIKYDRANPSNSVLLIESRPGPKTSTPKTVGQEPERGK
jgi:hypothetical protein